MAAQRKYPEELRERAVKMVFEIRERDGKGHGPHTSQNGGKHHGRSGRTSRVARTPLAFFRRPADPAGLTAGPGHRPGPMGARRSCRSRACPCVAMACY